MDTFETRPVADRFSLTLDGLCRAVAARITPGMAGWVMQTAMILQVWTRVRRVERTIQRLLAQFRAGRVWRARVSRQGLEDAQSMPREPTAKLPREPTAKLPRRLGWLLPMVPYEAANFSSQLRAILAEPEIVGLLGASAQARRVLAPLCRMLGIEADLLTPVAAAVEASERVRSAGVDWGFAAPVGITRGVAGGLIRRFPPGAG